MGLCQAPPDLLGAIDYRPPRLASQGLYSMDNEHIAKRAQDVQAGLRDVRDTLVSATIPITRQIGMAALLAVHIRGLDVIENIVGFHGFCASLGIPSDTVPLVLSTLEAYGMASRRTERVQSPAYRGVNPVLPRGLRRSG